MRDLWKFQQLLYIISQAFCVVLIIQKNLRCMLAKLFSILQMWFWWFIGCGSWIKRKKTFPAIFQFSKCIFKWVFLKLGENKTFLSSLPSKLRERGFREILSCATFTRFFQVHKFLIFHDVETWKGKSTNKRDLQFNELNFSRNEHNEFVSSQTMLSLPECWEWKNYSLDTYSLSRIILHPLRKVYYSWKFWENSSLYARTKTVCRKDFS